MSLRSPLLALSVGALAGCTTVLGIDGEYVENSKEAKIGNGGRAGEPGTISGGAGGSGGESGSGGNGGGGGGIGGAVMPPETGGCGAACAKPDPCAPGKYSGTFSGRHAPSTQLSFLPTLPFVTVSVGGTVSLTLYLEAPGTLSVSYGQFAGSFSGNGSFQALVGGTLDCATGHFDGTLVSGTAPTFKFAGTLAGDSDPTALTSLSGKWNEAEEPPVNGAVGSGTWKVTRCPPAGCPAP